MILQQERFLALIQKEIDRQDYDRAIVWTATQSYILTVSMSLFLSFHLIVCRWLQTLYSILTNVVLSLTNNVDFVGTTNLRFAFKWNTFTRNLCLLIFFPLAWKSNSRLSTCYWNCNWTFTPTPLPFVPLSL